MQFLKDIREHLKEFETEAQDEIHRFMDFLEQKYAMPTEAKPGPDPEPVGVETAFSPILPDPEPTPSDPTPEDEIPVATVEEPVEEPVQAVTTKESSVIATVAPSSLTCQPSK